MTKITVDENSGFCSGVLTAVNTALESGKVTTLGELIHNGDVIKMLEEKGVEKVNDISEIKTEKVIIRSHGVSPKVLEELNKSGLEVIDCTCPFVKKIQNIVKEKSENGYDIVICGKSTHPEVIGIAGNAVGKVFIVESEEELEKLDLGDKVCVVSQTTFSKDKFNKIQAFFEKNEVKTVEIFNTICYTTLKRQSSARELAKNSDLMVVIGDKKSANTNELFKICKAYCKDVIFCQNTREIENFDFVRFGNIGIVAGASTPKELVKEVKLTMEEKLQDLQPEKVADTKAAATDDISMEDVMSSLEKKKEFKRGQIIECTIESVADDGLHLSIPSAKTEVLLPKEEISLDGTYDKDAFKVGEKLRVKVLSNDGKLLISLKAIEEELKADESVQELIDGKPLTMSSHHKNKGGLRGRIGTYNVFVPSSQIRVGYVNEKDFDKYIDKPLTLRVIKTDAEKKELVASARVLLEEARKEKEDSFWSKIVVGETVNGKVMRFTSFGAFVSVDGFDCLAHISDLSWDNIKTCDEVLTIGESYDFKVLKADRETNKVSLGLKQLTKRPIDIIAEKYPEGTILKGKVTRLKAFGAFIEIEPGVEGLVHISQVSHTYVDNIAHALQEGEEVDVKVIGVDTAKSKINLSIKALLPEPERPAREEKPERERRPRKSNGDERAKREDELTNWVTGDSGASIADLLAKMENN